MSRFKDRLLAWATAVGALGTMLLCMPMCYYGIAAWVQVRDTVACSKLQGEDHEARIRLLEKEQADMRADVKWIRGSIEKNEKRVAAAN